MSPKWCWAVLAGLLLASASPARAGGGRAHVSAEARLDDSQGGEAISFSGAFTGVEGKKCKATVYLKCAVSEKTLDQVDCPVSGGGHFEGRFGPYDKPLWPQTYVVIVRATADVNAPPVGGGSGTMRTRGINVKEAPPNLVKTVLVEVHVSNSVEAQRTEQATRFRETLLMLRGLFLEVEQRVPSLKAKFAEDPDAAAKECEGWWKTWNERQAGLARTFTDRSYLDYWGNPFVAEYDALSAATDRLQAYANRAIAAIAGNEESRVPKSVDQLASEGKLPPRFLREQFLYALGLAFETLELLDPNRALVDGALSEVAEAFLSLRAAFHSEEMSPNGERMKRYRRFRDKARTIKEELACFYKDRRNVLPSEQRIQEQVTLLDTIIERLDDLERKYRERKEGKIEAAEIQKVETSLIMDLARGTLVLAVPMLQQAYDTAWGTYQSLIESYRGTPGFIELDPPNPADVRQTIDPAMKAAGEMLASAHKFIGEIGEGAPGMPPLFDVVRRAEEVSKSLEDLANLCEEMDAIEGAEARKSKADTAEARAKELAENLKKLKARMDEAFAPPK